MKLTKRLIFTILLLVMLTGCSTAVQPQPSQTPAINDASAYAPPASQPQPTGSYPAPAVTPVTDNNYPDKIEIPKPQAGFGVVTGVLLVQGTQKPYLAVLYLGTLIFSTNVPDAAPLVAYSPATDTHAREDKTGRFVFDAVKPGKYGMMLWTPVSDLLISNLDTGKFVEVDVVDGQVTDLGNIFVK